MKRISLIIAITCVITFAASAQSQSGLKGPEAKNFKPYIQQLESIKVIVLSDFEVVKGPVYKNSTRTTRSQNETLVVFSNPKSGLKGPGAKNFKYYRKES